MEHPVTSTLSDVDRDQLIHAAHAALGALRSLQKADGHWCAELEGDSILQSEYLLMKFILGQERQPMADGRDGWQTLTKIAAYLRMQQREDGGWGQYPGSGVDISATVKGYFALKLMGDDPDAPHMTAAREMIIAMGGAEQCNSFTKFYLACLGQISWRAVPAIPPEIVYLPRWFYFHMTKVSAWTRTMILPLSLVVTLRPQREVPRELGIDELYVSRRDRHRLMGKADSPAFWKGFFHAVDAALKLAHRIGGTPARRLAIRRAEQWILKRAGQDGIACTDGLGAIFPPMVYLQIAFMALGYSRDHKVIQRAERELDEFFIEQTIDGQDTIRIQPCFSPVWDTGIALYALTDCRAHDDESRHRASQWLLTKECSTSATGSRTPQPDLEPAGWAFEYHNAWYPDVDDSAMVAMALQRTGDPNNIAAAKRAVQWVLGAAERRRRLGRIRPHQGPRDPRVHALRRSQRHAGSLLS
jgi:squalene-hopene/tetraprenyl-beta-curcumene cyclase